MKDPRENVEYLRQVNANLQRLNDSLLRELAWTKETVQRWKRGELERDTN